MSVVNVCPVAGAIKNGDALAPFHPHQGGPVRPEATACWNSHRRPTSSEVVQYVAKRGNKNRLCVVGKREKEHHGAHAIQAQTPDIRRGMVEDAQSPHHHQTGPCCSDHHQRPHAVGCDKQHVNGTVPGLPDPLLGVAGTPCRTGQATRASSAPRKGTPRSGWTPTSIAEALCIRTGEVQVWQIGARGRRQEEGRTTKPTATRSTSEQRSIAQDRTFKQSPGQGWRLISARCKMSLTTVDQANVSTATAVNKTVVLQVNSSRCA